MPKLCAVTVTVTPIVTKPAKSTAPVLTTANEKAEGDTPAATISVTDLKILADASLTCKQQSVALDACTQTSALKDKKLEASQAEVTELKKVKLEPAWKKAVVTVGRVALGILIGKVL